jgi:hypothetical protein
MRKNGLVVGIFGVPSGLTERGAKLVQSLLVSVYGACDLISTAKIQDIPKLWPQNPKSVICCNETPEQSLIWFLREERIPIILFLDGFGATAQGLVTGRGMAVSDAIRAASLSFATLTEAALAETTFIISSHNQMHDVHSLLHQIARFLKLPLSSEQVAAIIQLLHLEQAPDGRIYLKDQNGRTPTNATAAASANDAVIAQVKNLSSGLSGYDQLLHHRFIHTLNWPGSLFYLIDKGAGPAIEPVDLLGPARYLVTGPYLGLPRGTWVAKISFIISANLSGNKLMFDVAADSGKEIIGRADYDMPKEGTFVAKLTFHHHRPHLTLELRSFLLQGAIEGSFEFHNVLLKLQ